MESGCNYSNRALKRLLSLDLQCMVYNTDTYSYQIQHLKLCTYSYFILDVHTTRNSLLLNLHQVVLSHVCLFACSAVRVVFHGNVYLAIDHTLLRTRVSNFYSHACIPTYIIMYIHSYH